MTFGAVREFAQFFRAALIFDAMVGILSIVLKFVFRLASLAVRIALSRITFILSFVAGLAASIYAIYDGLTDSTTFIGQSISAVSRAAVATADFVQGNEWLETLVYALSLDVILDGIVGSFIWVFCTLASALLVATVGVFFAALPMLAELTVSGLKSQILAKTPLS